MKSLLLRKIIVMSKSTFYGFILQSIFYGTILATDLNAQNSKKSIKEIYITINVKDASIKNVFNQIEQETGFLFAYNSHQVELKHQVSLNYKNSDLATVLMQISKDANLKFRRINNTIHVGKKRKSESISIEEHLTNQTNQKITIIGHVTSSENDSGLPGVNVILKGTSQGTVTDIDGNYKLDVPDENTVLIFSSVGFIKNEVTVGSQTVINIVMNPDLTALKEIVITSFGIKREKKSLTYSTQTVETENLTEARELNVLNTLEGKIAGLSINSSSAGIGAPSRVILRGNRVLSGDSQPLYVVDGVPIKGTIDYISPDNISSINVLKGPNAAALYGSAAQNGVIIVETKKGAGNNKDMVVSLNNTYMTLNPVLNIPFQNVYGQGLDGTYDKSSEFAWGPKMSGQMVETWSLDPEDAGKQYAFSPQPNNRKDLFQNGYNFSSNLFIGVNYEKTQTAFSYTYTDGEGLLPGNKLQRHNMFLRINNKIFKRLSLDTKIAYINNKIDNPFRQGNNSFNPVRQVYLMPANIRTEDVEKFEYKTLSGNMMQNFWYPGSTMGANPYWALYRVPAISISQNILVTTALNYDISDDLKFLLRGSYDGGTSKYDNRYYTDTYVRAPKGLYAVGQGSSYQLFGDALLSYEKEFDNSFDVSLNVGGSMKKNRNDGVGGTTTSGLVIPNFFTLSNTTVQGAENSFGASINVNSVYGFGNFSWKDAIYLDITGRNDWSSTLPADSRSYFYPSVGASVVLNELISFPAAITFTKLRASYAEVGNSARPYMLDRPATFTQGGRNGYLYYGSTLPNKHLVPERTKATELGLEMSFFDSRLGFDLTWYKTNTVNQLFTLALPVGSGAGSFYTNGGDVQNKGVEIVLFGTPVITNSLHWDIDINFSANRNLVVAINDERPRLVISSSYIRDFIIEQGQPFGEIYAKGWERDEQGRVIVGSNGIPLATHGKDVRVANFNPDWTAGITNVFNLKQFSLSFLITHRQGGTVVSNTNAVLDGKGATERTLDGREGGLIFGQNLFGEETAVLEDGSTNNIAVSAEEFWMIVGGRNNPIGEAFVRDATNMRLRELAFGYSIPQKTLANTPISNVKISLVGRNLFYIYRASPELDVDLIYGTGPSAEGYTNFAPPTTRSIGFNLKIDF